MQEAYVSLPDASAHHPSEQVIYRAEQGWIWSLFDSDHKLVLMKNLSPATPICHESGVV